MLDKEKLNKYEQSPGRTLEILIGLIVASISIVLVYLVVLIVKSAKFSIGTILGCTVLAYCAYWFGEIAYRLILNRKRENGGLLSRLALKAWTILLGIVSAGTIVIGLFLSEYRLATRGAGMLIVCFAGWCLAEKREHGAE